MDEEKSRPLPKVGAMKKRRVVMADGRRYLIYYTFEEREPVPENQNNKVKTDE